MANIVQNIVRRARTWMYGSLKQPDPERPLFFVGNKSKIVVTEENVDHIPSFFRAKQLIAENVASVDCSVYKRDGEQVEEAITHPLYKLLKFRPHPLYNSFVFWETIIRHMIDRGEAFVRIYRDDRGAIFRLEIIDEAAPDIYPIEDTYFYHFGCYEMPLASKEVLHFCLYSNNGYQGRGQIDIFRETLGRAIAEIQYTAAHFGNGAHPSGFLTTEMPLDKETRAELSNSFKREYGGSENFGKVGVLSHGLTFQGIQQPVGDNEIKARKLTVQDISNMLGVHTEMLGLSGETGITNIETLNRMLVQYVFRVWTKRIEDEINSKAFGDRDLGRLFIRFDLTELLRGDHQARSQMYEALYRTQAINPNEIRRKEGMNPYPGGDEYGKPLASNIKTETPSDEEE